VWIEVNGNVHRARSVRDARSQERRRGCVRLSAAF